MNVTAFRTVRGRLLALMVLVIVPIAVITAVTAVATYRSVLSSIEASQLQTVGHFAVRTRVWYRESLRVVLAATASVAAVDASAEQCLAIARRIVGDNLGVSAIAIRAGERPGCSASQDDIVSAEEIRGVIETYRTRTRTATWIGAELADTSYGVILLGARRFMVIYARRANGPHNQVMESLLLVSADIIDRAFDLGTVNPGVTVGIVRDSSEVVVARGVNEDDMSWLPVEGRSGPQLQRWVSASRSGMTATYGSQLVAEPDLYVLARFDQQAERAAFLQFIALLLTPLVTLTVLFAVYSLAIDSNIVRWIRGIEAAAVARASQQPRLAPVEPTMPDDMRRVSEAFNALVTDQAERVEKLNLTIGANRHLVRELHHRVKNSLQVVQSYISLARRQQDAAHRPVLAAIEAKVQVLSSAYRHALALGEMRPVELRPFLDEVCGMLNGLMQAGRPWISAVAPEDVALVVDRAIPLGLLVVEIASHAMQDGHADHVAVEITCGRAGHLILSVITDDRRMGAVETKIGLGLLRQIGATRTEDAAGTSVGRWDVPL
ncbi:MAG: sensor histidine kinase [Phreatobacter sp.]|uniref:sensor histidine kinase n=1 Tax=Phreatobacter sp. TaxID=1966341 RepID=UPI00273390F8|nr:sensor histidine kinase [Phreatobacter sp.]MDP2803398.1 sensor histidine kinase [Phreatobacter sp.]